MAFVMVPSHSRMVFLRFFLDARMDSFLRGHALALAAFGGVPRVLLHDVAQSVRQAFEAERGKLCPSPANFLLIRSPVA